MLSEGTVGMGDSGVEVSTSDVEVVVFSVSLPPVKAMSSAMLATAVVARTAIFLIRNRRVASSYTSSLVVTTGIWSVWRGSSRIDSSTGSGWGFGSAMHWFWRRGLTVLNECCSLARALRIDLPCIAMCVGVPQSCYFIACRSR